MNAYQRVVAALTGREPDRVPVLLLMPTQGAGELGLPLPTYLGDPEAMAEGQLRLQARYGHDCLYAFSYGAAEAEAFGASVEYHPTGSPVVSEPPFGIQEVGRITPPDPHRCPALVRTLRLIELLAAEDKGRLPILANVVAPPSLPVMLLGMEAWLELLLLGDAGRRDQVLEVCRAFTLAWGRAQVQAGADALGYFDPLASPEITTPAQFARFHLQTMRLVAEQVGAPLLLCTAGARNLQLLPAARETGMAGILASAAESLADYKQQADGKLAVAGNLNNIGMAAWTPAQASQEVRSCLAAGAPGGGYLLCDQHGEIPTETPAAVLEAIMQTAQQYGRYPLHQEGR